MKALYPHAPIGQVFGRLTVTGRGQTASYWVCRCACGANTEARYRHILRGSTKSCGCLNSEITVGRNKSHGWTHHPAFPIWDGMRRRCYDPKAPNHDRYGGRGITVCPEWLESCEKFSDDMGPRPPGTSIDRIDNSRGYAPDNCRWATPREQQNNTRRNVFVTVRGERLSLMEAARKYGVPYTTLRGKMSRGMTAEQVLDPEFQSQMREYAR